MPVSYSKWDNFEDSDEEEAEVQKKPVVPKPDADAAMADFFSLSRDASIKDIQKKIASLPAETREELLRHEKGGLLKRMMDLDPDKSYEAGEIFGTTPKPAAGSPQGKAPASKAPAAKAPAAKAPAAKAPAAKAPAPKAPALNPAPKTVLKPTPKPELKPASAKADDGDDGARIVDITDEVNAANDVAPAPAPAPKASASSGPATKASVDYRKFDKMDLADIDDDDESPPPPKPSCGLDAAAMDAAAADYTAAFKSATPENPAGEKLPPSLPVVPAVTADTRSFTFVRLPVSMDAPIDPQIGARADETRPACGQPQATQPPWPRAAPPRPLLTPFVCAVRTVCRHAMCLARNRV